MATNRSHTQGMVDWVYEVTLEDVMAIETYTYINIYTVTTTTTTTATT